MKCVFLNSVTDIKSDLEPQGQYIKEVWGVLGDYLEPYTGKIDRAIYNFNVIKLAMRY
jgi:hypothetical protein